MNRVPFAHDEWYHCYSRGVEKRTVFENKTDYERFLKGMYLANSTESFRITDIEHLGLGETLTLPRKEPIVSIAAFSLMPNHFHILVQQRSDMGISSFMRKLNTAYTMYFNTKRQRVGNLFVKPFRSKHVADDTYFQQCVRYIHCNAADLYDPTWRSKKRNLDSLTDSLVAYPYASLGFLQDRDHILKPILDHEAVYMIEEQSPTRMFREAAEYYWEIGDLTR